MKKIFSIMAAALAFFTANAQTNDQAVTYMEYYYASETNSVVTTFPNAARVSYNAKTTVNIKKDGENYVKGEVAPIEGKANEFNLAISGELVPGTYTISVRAAAFTCFANTEDEVGVDNEACVMTWTIEEAGIESITMDDQKAEIFNLSGRRVNELVPGQVYIKNGSKFIAR